MDWSHLDTNKLDDIVSNVDKLEIMFQANRGAVERHDDPPRLQIRFDVRFIGIRMVFSQVRHLGSFAQYLKRYERYELSRKLGARHLDANGMSCPRPQLRIQQPIGEVLLLNVAESCIRGHLLESRVKADWSGRVLLALSMLSSTPPLISETFDRPLVRVHCIRFALKNDIDVCFMPVPIYQQVN